MRSGRLPLPGDENEVVVSEPFARANHFTIDSTFDAILNGRKRTLRIVGTALSPEFIYSLGPYGLIPDDRRYGIVWMREKALAAAYDLTGAFSSVHLKLTRAASEAEAVERLDGILTRYGGLGAHGRRDQTSHAFLDAELSQLKAMSRILPPVFLLVAAFLVNMTLSRLILLEREHIGLLKALGYSGVAVGWHRSPFTMGCFGVWSEEARARHYDNLCQIDGRIALAGEHASYLPAWQEGAVTSALDAIGRIHQRVVAGASA